LAAALGEGSLVITCTPVSIFLSAGIFAVPFFSSTIIFDDRYPN